METLNSVEGKRELLRMRREEEKQLGLEIDRLMARAGEPTPGCGFCSIWRKLSRRQQRAVISMTTSEDASSVEQSSMSKKSAKAVSSAQSRLFGMKKQSANERLAQAAEALKTRLLQLESRAASEREEAKSAMKSGQKSTALRMLKRSKMTEKQVEAAQQSLLAIEQQVDLLAQAAMQKEIASALASSASGFKANKKLVQNAESAVDDAQEARDMAEDLSNALSELGANDNGDDDELLSELKSMVDDDPPNTTDEVEISLSDDAEEAKRQEISRLEAKIARWDEAEAVRQSMPSAPKTKKAQNREEKKGLLAAS